MKKRWLVIAGALLGTLIIGALVYFRLKGEDVKAIRMQREDVVATLTVTGEVQADTTVSFSPKVNARIDRILVDEGDTVTPGQLLVELSRADVNARLLEAEAREAQSRASLTELQQGTRSEELRLWEERLAESRHRVSQTEASLAAAQARLEEAASNARRFQQLLGEGFATAQEAQQADTNLAVAQREVSRLQADLSASRAQVKQIEAQLSEARTGPRQTEIQAAAAARRAEQAGIQEIRASLQDYMIRSNMNGIVVDRLQDPGELGTPGKAILKVINPATLEIVTSVEENDLAKIRLGDTGFVLLDALPERPLEARVTEIGSEVNPDNGTVEVTVVLQPQAYKKLAGLNLLPGMTADVNVITERLKNVLVLPAAAVRRRGEQWIVYLIRGKKIVEHPVAVRRISMENYQVLDGLEPGDWVASSISPKLLGKKRVNPVPADLKAPKPKPPGGSR